MSHPLTPYVGARLNIVMPFALAIGGWSYRRAGLQFGREPVDIGIEQLSDKIEMAVETLIGLASEGIVNAVGTNPILSIVVIQTDGTEFALDDDRIGALKADLAAYHATAKCEHCGRLVN